MENRSNKAYSLQEDFLLLLQRDVRGSDYSDLAPVFGRSAKALSQRHSKLANRGQTPQLLRESLLELGYHTLPFIAEGKINWGSRERPISPVEREEPAEEEDVAPEGDLHPHEEYVKELNGEVEELTEALKFKDEEIIGMRQRIDMLEEENYKMGLQRDAALEQLSEVDTNLLDYYKTELKRARQHNENLIAAIQKLIQ